jgi:hypothetical protein
MALGIIRTRITAIETRRVKAPEKTADSIYHTPEYRRWRAGVIARAGGRCEHVTDGVRCTKGSPVNRMFADHIVELRDGGSPSIWPMGGASAGATTRPRQLQRGPKGARADANRKIILFQCH